MGIRIQVGQTYKFTRLQHEHAEDSTQKKREVADVVRVSPRPKLNPSPALTSCLVRPGGASVQRSLRLLRVLACPLPSDPQLTLPPVSSIRSTRHNMAANSAPISASETVPNNPDWMALLPPSLHSAPLTTIAIPGESKFECILQLFE